MTGPPPPEAALDWVPTARLRRLALVAAFGVIAAVVMARGELLVVAALPLVVLAVRPRSGLPRSIRAFAELQPARCVEGDEITVSLAVEGRDVDRVEATLALPPETEAQYLRAEDGTRRWVLVPQRWGRHAVGPVTLRVLAPGGCYQAQVAVPVDDVVVYPAAGALARAVAPRELAAPLGEHPSRAVGNGLEFAGLRPYVAGDRRRDVDWRTSARHGDLYVRQYAADRAFDLVLVLDTATDAGPPGASTLDLTVRAASGLAQSYLRAHDRVGLLTFGGPLRWLRPATGPRQRYQVYEALMSVRPDVHEREAGEVTYGLENLPRAMLPHRAFVALLTPLLDDRPVDAVQLLVERGFTPLVIDVLTTEPAVRRGSMAELALRTWRLQREALTVELGSLGVPVVAWDGEADLTGPLLQTMRSLRPGKRT